MKKVLILGAFDRYNYGDLLFPIVIQHQLDQYGFGFEYHYFGIINSDLTKYGGVKTHNIKSFYEFCDGSESNVIVIIAGGETIDVTWDSLAAALSKKYLFLNRIIRRLPFKVNRNNLTKRLLGGKTILPFTFSKKDFKRVSKVFYNSLGGSKVDKSLFSRFPKLASTLNYVDFFSVRDEITKSKLKAGGVQTHLYPDSAILMSKFFPVNFLSEKCTEIIGEYVSSNKLNYVFFQVNKSRAAGNEKAIATLLDKIYQDYGLKICLCPIGKASNHDDQVALKTIKNFMTVEPDFFEDVNVWDIMFLIANARTYVGTSLHGAITAMSFCVPYVGVNVLKLNSYLKTWGVEPLTSVVGFEEMIDRLEKALEVSKEELRLSRDHQIKLAEEAFEKMANQALEMG